MTNNYCQTKTGRKIHDCGANSSRTYCGAKVARRLLHMGMPNAYTEFCGACGLNGEYIRAMAEACRNMFRVFHTP